ncbi:hypothetical protein LOTGIDRAFT_164012 [Lottia gigantea]|uniref:C-type lectin domain-containing protein n=1 Tax=Lottia gigantea TaxID=225164 RepID=V4A613_LOTGI|nr:hypothetical protein LOTGIDRAFT_164012 [Lottia gigantea]ESO90430.1 hypothetical protein LOTGIDRAFT_164012 [Lottia gigantea]
MAVVQDGLCYCLNPRPNIFNQLRTPATVFALSRESVCRYKGYEILTKLGICIKYSNISVRWDDARGLCNQDGGYLINLNTAAKATAILNMSLAYNVDLIHIGGYMSIFTTWYNWTRGGVIDGQFWAASEPSPLVLKEYCMAMYKKDDILEFGNLGCSLKRPYLCELLL